VRRELAEPVGRIPTDSEQEPTTGTALCLSGGGYRAMLFHLGVLWRLNEAGKLDDFDRISSVSGGSITAAMLGLAWSRLDGSRSAFEEHVVMPLRELGRHSLEVRSVVTGLASPDSIGEALAGAYRKRVFGTATLQDLPDRPRFVINATNVGTGELVRFSKDHIADWRVGRIAAPTIEVAAAVACSSAFPPILSPYRIDMRDSNWETEEGNDLTSPDYRDELVLTDGGVYDNLGLETAWKRCFTIFVSDAGSDMPDDPDPAIDWVFHMARVVKMIDKQVRSLRKRQVVGAYEAGVRMGAYIGIRSDIDHYELADPLPCPRDQTLKLAQTRTRLKHLGDELQERLINWGYAICDAGLRAHLDRSTAKPEGFPYPRAGVG
jgi:NTE family protein